MGVLHGGVSEESEIGRLETVEEDIGCGGKDEEHEEQGQMERASRHRAPLVSGCAFEVLPQYCKIAVVYQGRF